MDIYLISATVAGLALANADNLRQAFPKVDVPSDQQYGWTQQASHLRSTPSSYDYGWNDRVIASVRGCPCKGFSEAVNKSVFSEDHRFLAYHKPLGALQSK